jgi:C4-dicarboxylate-specific signal transduction histidine kinase
LTSADTTKLRATAIDISTNQAGLHTALQRAYDDLRQSQLALLQQERLRALGQMASGIAHDINNAISPVSLYTEALLESEPATAASTRVRQLDDARAHRDGFLEISFTTSPELKSPAKISPFAARPNVVMDRDQVPRSLLVALLALSLGSCRAHRLPVE